ncbi:MULTISPECIES: hypothetical protein [unclassified Streptomyces]|uniref:hypothetical protein n=1 Tax=unclassified Streptomyces TaxID=2593676 RepID=UPI0022B06639|nr:MULTISPECIES: hypothetical protein [unclassified Streptomyces]MCZ4097292.1 hypothetical protein [Streptomyces sp. H39-C1]MCZ4120596.1 hypothetical protein [Streptomyces sp. H39-S7]
MDTRRQTADDDVRRIAENTADELAEAFAKIGFNVVVTPDPPMYGRAFVAIAPMRHDVAVRLIDELGKCDR